MSRPIQFLMKHQQPVVNAFLDNGRQPKKTWENLRDMLPDLADTMSFNTFKQYLSVLMVILPELDKVRREKNELVRQLDKTTREKSELEQRFGTLKERFDGDVAKDKTNGPIGRKSRHAAKRVLGWSIQQSKDGYYRCFRKINSRVHCIYIGKTLVLETTKAKILEKERALGLRRG